jgi:Mn-dependent DtxR family transcriptional regulator
MSEELIRQFLFAEYQKLGNKDFYVRSRKLSRILKLSTWSIGHHLGTLQSEGLVRKDKQKLWITNFNHAEEKVKDHWWSRINR